MKPQTHTIEMQGKGKHTHARIAKMASAQPETRGFKETSGQMIQRLCNELNTVTAQRDELATLSHALAMIVLQSDIYHLAKGEVDSIIAISKATKPKP